MNNYNNNTINNIYNVKNIPTKKKKNVNKISKYGNLQFKKSFNFNKKKKQKEKEPANEITDSTNDLEINMDITNVLSERDRFKK